MGLVGNSKKVYIVSCLLMTSYSYAVLFTLLVTSTTSLGWCFSALIEENDSVRIAYGGSPGKGEEEGCVSSLSGYYPSF